MAANIVPDISQGIRVLLGLILICPRGGPLFVGVDGSYNFKNDNEAYPPEKIPAAMFSSLNLEVLGKVVWWGGKWT